MHRHDSRRRIAGRTRSGNSLAGSWQGTLDGQAVGGDYVGSLDGAAQRFTGTDTNAAGKVAVAVGGCSYQVAALGRYTVYGAAASEPASCTLDVNTSTVPTLTWAAFSGVGGYTVRRSIALVWWPRRRSQPASSAKPATRRAASSIPLPSSPRYRCNWAAPTWRC